MYLKQAKNLQTTGILLTAVGPVMLVTLYAIGHSENSSLSLNAMEGLSLVGIMCTLAGIPTLITDSARIKAVLPRGVSVQMVPYYSHNPLAQTQQHGATLRIKF